MKALSEVEALVKLDEALSSLDDEEGRGRILRWACEKFGVSVAPRNAHVPAPLAAQLTIPNAVASIQPANGEIPGIAKFVGDELKIVARDIKASSTNDAAVRLTHIAIRANELLTGSESVSSRHIVLPILKSWRCSTGNTRAALVQQKGILRSGDLLSLDEHGKRDADEFIRQCSDPSVEGAWKPSAGAKKAGKKPSKSRAQSKDE